MCHPWPPALAVRVFTDAPPRRADDDGCVSQLAAYPGASEVDIALRDGSTLHVRPVAAEDRPAIEAFLAGLSRESIGFRFFGAVNLEWVADWSVDVDYADRYALVAVTGGVQLRRSWRTPRTCATGGERAEVAFLVADAWQGRGIATIMLAHLAAAAQAHGIALFTAEVLPAQPPHDRGLPRQRLPGRAALQRRGDRDRAADLALGRPRWSASSEREQTAAVAALRSFLCPRSVAVIGASRRRRHGGRRRSCATSSPAASRGRSTRSTAARARVQGRRAHDRRCARRARRRSTSRWWRSPRRRSRRVARECGAAGVRALLVISAGFAETGREGAARQQRAARDLPRDAACG